MEQVLPVIGVVLGVLIVILLILVLVKLTRRDRDEGDPLLLSALNDVRRDVTQQNDHMRREV